jgi:hypothetical protein
MFRRLEERGFAGPQEEIFVFADVGEGLGCGFFFRCGALGAFFGAGPAGAVLDILVWPGPDRYPVTRSRALSQREAPGCRTGNNSAIEDTTFGELSTFESQSMNETDYRDKGFAYDWGYP